jgi:hypothetical protein
MMEQLKNIKLDFQTYGNLPIREDVVILKKKTGEANKEISDQWEKLGYLRKNLVVLDRYINDNSGLILKDWLAINNISISTEVIKTCGNHNDSTGGISAYFLNLENFYNEQEGIYDNMESNSLIPEDIKKAFDKLREERLDKRKNRSAVRKIKLKDLKSDDKGYLTVGFPEEEIIEKEFAANGETLTKEDEVKVKEKIADAVTILKTEKPKSNLGGWLLLTLTLGGIGFAIYKSDKGE